MSWYLGGIPLLVYAVKGSVATKNYLLETDHTPLLLTDMTGMLLAGS